MSDEDAAGKIKCEICGGFTHFVQSHLQKEHPEITIEGYQEAYPDAPLFSEKGLAAIEKNRINKAKGEGVVSEPAESTEVGGFRVSKQSLHELFGLGAVKSALGNRGNAIPVSVYEVPEYLQDYVPEVDDNYVWQIDILKNALMAIETNMPGYLHGHSGTGKSSLWDQICALTRRPMLRVQHTAATEESHVVGQWTVKNGNTEFELGPLAYCMKHGLVYLADEYDFGMPQILALYQPVLEGKPLVIKEADHANRVIKPHPLFRMIATGNTNGTGDETGLYQGTMVQNAANYERFGYVEEVPYMDERSEVAVVSGQGGIPKEQAEKLVKFANSCRQAFVNSKLGLPPSPRALINAAKQGKRRGDLGIGLKLAYINRLSRIDQKVASELLQKIAM